MKSTPCASDIRFNWAMTASQSCVMSLAASSCALMPTTPIAAASATLAAGAAACAGTSCTSDRTAGAVDADCACEAARVEDAPASTADAAGWAVPCITACDDAATAAMPERSSASKRSASASNVRSDSGRTMRVSAISKESR